MVTPMSEPLSLPWPGFDPNQPDHQALLAFLRLDIQNSQATAKAVCTGVTQYLNQERETFGGSANAFDFECEPEGLRLESLYAEGDAVEAVHVAYPEVLRALNAWMERNDIENASR